MKEGRDWSKILLYGIMNVDWDDDEWDKVNESEELEKTQALVAGIVKEYCQTGKYADKLRKLQGVGVGFCDGPLQLVYQQDYK